MDYKEEIFMKTVEQLGQWLEIPKTYVLNPERMKLLRETCDKLQAVLDEEFNDCTINVKFCPLGFGDVTISFDTDSLVSRNVKKFYEAIQHLSNFEMYPVGDEKIHFAGIFPRVARPITLTKPNKEVSL